MDPSILQPLLNLMAANLGFTISYIVLFSLHFWAFALYLHRGQRTAHQSLERIEASAERIATMVRELHNR